MNDSPHKTSLIEKPPTVKHDGGVLTTLTAANFPILEGLSIQRLQLAPGTAREPYWNVNADQLSYCLSGTVIVTLFLSGSQYQRFAIHPGQMFFVPSGGMATIENIGPDEVEIITAFTHESPEVIGLSGSLGVMTDAVVGDTVDLTADALAGRSHDPISKVVLRVDPAEVETLDDDRLNPYKFDVEAMEAPVDTASGKAKTARTQFWPILQNIAMYSLTIADEGMREPHWHPKTVELGYVHQGSARMTILLPDGSFDTYELQKGDVYIVPVAYPHQIEDIGEGDLHFLIFFSQGMPLDIGYRAALSALRPETIAAAMDLKLSDLPALPFTPSDPLIVGRVNAVDPVPSV